MTSETSSGPQDGGEEHSYSECRMVLTRGTGFSENGVGADTGIMALIQVVRLLPIGDDAVQALGVPLVRSLSALNGGDEVRCGEALSVFGAVIGRYAAAINAAAERTRSHAGPADDVASLMKLLAACLAEVLAQDEPPLPVGRQPTPRQRHALQRCLECLELSLGLAEGSLTRPQDRPPL